MSGRVSEDVVKWDKDGTPLLTGEWSQFLTQAGIKMDLTPQKSTRSLKCTRSGETFNSIRNSQRFGMTPKDQKDYVIEDTTNRVPKPEGVLMALDMELSRSIGTSKLKLNQLMSRFKVPRPNKADQDATLIFNVIEKFDQEATFLFQVDATDTRAGIWLLPGDSMRMVNVMSFRIDDAALASCLGKMAAVCKDYFGFSPAVNVAAGSLRIQFQQSFDATVNKGKLEVVENFVMTVGIPLAGFMVWVTYSPSEVSCTLTENPDVHSTSFIDRFRSLGASSSLETGDLDSKLQDVDMDSDNMRLWYATIGRTLDTPAKTYFDISILVSWKPKSSVSVLLEISYNSQERNFTGRLVFEDSLPSAQAKLLPSYEDNYALPSGVSPISGTLDLGNLFPDAASGPFKIVPSGIHRGQVDIGLGPPKRLSVYLGLQTTSRQDEQPVPMRFQWDNLTLRATKVGTEKPGFVIQTFASLVPADTLKFHTGTLSARIEYARGVWNLQGEINDVEFAAFADCLPEDVAEPFTEILGKVTIKQLKAYYTFTKPTPPAVSAAASSFLFTGDIVIGKLELLLNYQCISSQAPTQSAAQQQNVSDRKPRPQTGSVWSFSADLGASSPSTTLGDVIDAFDDDAADNLPDFVRKIPIAAANGRTGSLVSLDARSIVSSDAKKTPGLVLVLTINLGEFEILIASVAYKKSKAKKIFRVTCSGIPLLDDIPLIKQLPQPFDKLMYMWVIGDALGKGWTADEVAAVSESGSTVFVKAQNQPASPSDANTPAILLPGHHFMIIDGGAVVLDHIFGAAKKPRPAPASVLDDEVLAVPPPAALDDTPQPTKGALAKKTSTITISNLGLQYKNKRLSVFVDASVMLGPINVDLLGFGFSVPIEGFTLDKLSSIPVEQIKPIIRGLGVGFNKPPLTLAGVFEYEDNDRLTAYRGGVAVGFPPYVFMAVGEYTEVKQPDPYKSFFIFAKLDGPIVTLEFATISGVRLGFGYNSLVRSPSLDELYLFPFVSDAGVANAGTNPMAMLNSMTRGVDGQRPWVTPKQKSYWFAAGMTVSAFELLAITAVALIGFRDVGVTIAIYADAVAQMPPKVEREMSIIYVQLTMVAELNMIEDYFRVEASLAPTSFILIPTCQLQGGFALCYWFGRSPHAGDWVFSVGGYHRSYKPPAWYPVPKRLGVRFTCGNCLRITAEAYFAITPKCVMGGAHLHISLDVGPVSAYLDASFDAIINFEPFHYQVDMRVTIGINFNLDVLFIHIHIHVEIGADLRLEGPEFGGVAHVDFYLFGFDVYFGKRAQKPSRLVFSGEGGFYQLVHKLGPDTESPQATDTTDGTMKYLKFNLEDGAYPMPVRDTVKSNETDTNPTPNTGAGADWHVKGGTFRFRISCDVVISKISLSTTNAVSASIQDTMFVKPMQASLETSTLHVTILKVITDIELEPVSGFLPSEVTKTVPTALWSQYNQDADPVNSRNKDELKKLMLDSKDATVNRVMGYSLLSPDPELAKSMMPVFDPTAAMNQPVRDKGTNELFSIIKATEPPQSVYLLGLAEHELDPSKPHVTGSEKWAATRAKWEKSYHADLIGDGKLKSSDFGVEKPDTQKPDTLLSLCAETLGWNVLDPARLAEVTGLQLNDSARQPWELQGTLPSKLISGSAVSNGTRVDGLEEYYLALPTFTIV